MKSKHKAHASLGFILYLKSLNELARGIAGTSEGISENYIKLGEKSRDFFLNL